MLPNRLLPSYMAKEYGRVSFAKQRAAWDLSVGIIAAMMAFDISENKELYVPVTDDRFLLTGRDCPLHTGCNDFEGRERRHPAAFVLVSDSECINVLVYHLSHIYVYYSVAEKKSLSKLLRLKVVNLACCVFVGHGYPRHAVCN